MPDLLDRTEREDEIAAALIVLFNQYQERALKLLGSPPDASNIPADFYDELEQEIENALTDPLAATYGFAGEQLAGQFDANLDAARYAREAQRWAENRASELAADIRQRIEDSIAEAVAAYHAELEEKQAAALAAAMILLFGTDWQRTVSPATVERNRPELDPQTIEEQQAKLRDSLDSIFGTDRAEAVGITETTGAVTAGENRSAGDIENVTGVKLVAWWKTEHDKKVCPECRLLEATPESFWNEYAPSGPPRHPNCRCYLVWLPVGEEMVFRP